MAMHLYRVLRRGLDDFVFAIGRNRDCAPGLAGKLAAIDIFAAHVGLPLMCRTAITPLFVPNLTRLVDRALPRRDEERNDRPFGVGGVPRPRRVDRIIAGAELMGLC
jgi:hypothetical protein